MLQLGWGAAWGWHAPVARGSLVPVCMVTTNGTRALMLGLLTLLALCCRRGKHLASVLTEVYVMSGAGGFMWGVWTYLHFCLGKHLFEL